MPSFFGWIGLGAGAYLGLTYLWLAGRAVPAVVRESRCPIYEMDERRLESLPVREGSICVSCHDVDEK